MIINNKIFILEKSIYSEIDFLVEKSSGGGGEGSEREEEPSLSIQLERFIIQLYQIYYNN